MNITRKRFLGAVGGGTVALWLQGCGGGSDDDDNGPPQSCGASGTAIAGNHGHVLTIPAADLNSLTDKTYSIQGSAGHDHTVTLTAAQLASLKAGQNVAVNSTTVSAHMHVVTANCA
ncbi:MAG TPA: hypothetical protein VFY73_23665 [Ideonella sp.]|uniref:hypothetical protein n=1 Tax=Ideonella sp. TaxID=1929293 RepID=UPI002E37EA0C|nr:hypothetical protein [Ideonella sp.]HEX5687022.1 hypothetical protein [Ideonella sp.]